MRQTLFYIPTNWIIIAWCIGCVIALVLMLRRNRWEEVRGFIPFALVTGAVVFWGLPYIAATGPDPGDPTQSISLGLPIRGYGFFLLLATIAGVGLAVYRARTIGIDPDHIFSLAFWMFIIGIAGARLFYVIQKHEEFDISSPASFLVALVSMNKGGLVVYGSLIGALIAFVGFSRIKRLPMLDLADIIAPSMILGLCIGRIGCLMNGCCFGGVCDVEQIGIRFPEGSPPYHRQLETGEVLGIQGKKVLVERKDKDGNKFNYPLIDVQAVEPGSVAARSGIQPGERIDVQFDLENYEISKVDPKTNYVWLTKEGEPKSLVIPILNDQLPDYSLKVHPTQIYSSINAGLIFLFLWSFFPYRQRSGQVLAILLMIYPISRTILEFIRTDELGIWGTPFTISQWVSLLIFLIGLCGYAYIMLSRQADLSDKNETATTFD